MDTHIDSIIQRAEREAEAIRRAAERDAEDTRREAIESVQRLLDRLNALEFPLGSLVASLREETEEVSRQLEAGAQASEPHPARSTARKDHRQAAAMSQAEEAEPSVQRRRQAIPPREPDGWQRWLAGDEG